MHDSLLHAILMYLPFTRNFACFFFFSKDAIIVAFFTRVNTYIITHVIKLVYVIIALQTLLRYKNSLCDPCIFGVLQND